MLLPTLQFLPYGVASIIVFQSVSGINATFKRVENDGTAFPDEVTSTQYFAGETARFLLELKFTPDYTPRDLSK